MNSDRWLTDQPLLLEPLLAETEDSSCGALVVFAGTVRDHQGGASVTALTYEAHETLAAAAIAAIEARTLAAHPKLRLRIRHRTGALALGDTAVLVVVRAPHRREAFAIAEAALEASMAPLEALCDLLLASRLDADRPLDLTPVDLLALAAEEGARVGAPVEEQARHFESPLVARSVQRGALVPVGRVHRCATLKYRGHALRVPIVRRHQQRRAAHLVED
jgi:molybdopterin synthase catalytic subunit